MPVAVISGTTAGLGRSFVDAVIDECPEVDEIWMIARRKERLEAIAAQYPRMRFVPLALDLSDEASYDELQRQLEVRKPNIRTVISNAGVAKSGLVEQTDPQDLKRMIRLNALGSTMLIRLCLPHMRRGSYIVQVSSISSFAPNPFLATYSATKAYDSYFAAALREELKPRGINVLRLNPGNMATEMQSGVVAHPDESHAGMASRLPFLNVSKLAHTTLKKAKSGRASYTMNLVYRGYQVLAKLVPMSVMTRFSKA